MTAQAQIEQKVTIAELFGLTKELMKSNPEIKIPAINPELAHYVPAIKDKHHFTLETFRDLWEFQNSGFKDGCLFITGPKGIGKSSTTEQFYARLNKPVFKATGHARLELSDLLGVMGLNKGETVYRYGPLTLAAKHGGVFIFDEADACPPEVLVGLHGILEMGSKLILPENGGELIDIHPDFRVVVTGNTAGSGDYSGNYAGTVIQNSATLDRFNFLEWGYPSLDVEFGIVLDAVPQMLKAQEFVLSLIKVAHQTREGGVEAISTRTLIRWVRKAAAFKGEPIKVSLDRAFTFRLDEEKRSEVYAVASTVLGQEAFYGQL